MRSPRESPYPPAPSPLLVASAVLRTVAYADVFDYPLNQNEVHRYLHGVDATPAATAEALEWHSRPEGPLRRRDDFYTLRDREGLVDVRRRRMALADRLWPAAVTYGHLIATLPFVRMVAVTGSLAWDNVDRSRVTGDPPDVDYLIVAEPGRVWLCRWFVAALGRVARLQGVILCPNYVLSARALTLTDRTLYAALELARATPVAGLRTYRRLRRANPWVERYLPNAGESSVPSRHARPRLGWLGSVLRPISNLLEMTLRTAAGTLLERWEMRYRTWKRRRGRGDLGEAAYAADWFKEHLGDHAQYTRDAFAQRLHDLEREF